MQERQQNDEQRTPPRRIDWLDATDFHSDLGDRVELGPEPDESGFDAEAYDNAGGVTEIRIGLCDTTIEERG